MPIECTHITAMIGDRPVIHLIASMKFNSVCYVPEWRETRRYDEPNKLPPYLDGANIAVYESCWMRTFSLFRIHDVSGVSGTGRVAQGVAFPNGPVAMEWLRAPFAFSIHNSEEDLLSIHGHGGATKLIWENMR